MGSVHTFVWMGTAWAPSPDTQRTVVDNNPTQVFTTFRWPVSNDETINTAWVTAHWARVSQHAASMGWPVPAMGSSPNPIVAGLHPLLVEKNTAAATQRRVSLYIQRDGLVGASIEALPGFSNSAWVLHTVSYHHPAPTIKHNARHAANTLLQQLKQKQRVDDVLWQHSDGGITEATIANVLGLRVDDDDVITVYIPPCTNRLNGLVERCVLHAITSMSNPSVRVVQHRITPGDLTAWEGALLSNSVRGVWPIKQIDTTIFSWPKALQQFAQDCSELWPSVIATLLN